MRILEALSILSHSFKKSIVIKADILQRRYLTSINLNIHYQKHNLPVGQLTILVTDCQNLIEPYKSSTASHLGKETQRNVPFATVTQEVKDNQVSVVLLTIVLVLPTYTSLGFTERSLHL